MTIIDTLIFDRVIDDVLRIAALADLAKTRELTTEELALWNASVVRGAYNVEDLNRVGSAIRFADAYLSTVQPGIDAYREALGVADDEYFDAHISDATAEIVPRTDYKTSESPIMADGIKLTMTAGAALAERVGIVYKAPDASRFGYSAANAIERMIYDAYHYGVEKETTRKESAEKMASAWYFSGDLFCGEIQ